MKVKNVYFALVMLFVCSFSQEISPFPFIGTINYNGIISLVKTGARIGLDLGMVAGGVVGVVSGGVAGYGCYRLNTAKFGYDLKQTKRVTVGCTVISLIGLTLATGSFVAKRNFFASC